MESPKDPQSKNKIRLLQLFVGWVLYPSGDLVGQLIMGNFSLPRVLVMMLAGGVVYRFEIPRWFAFIEKKRFKKDGNEKFPLFKYFVSEEVDGYKFNWLGKTISASIYFNPIWIFRHLLFIALATTPFSDIVLGELLGNTIKIATISFFTNLPIAVAGNYIIQQKMSLKYRFLGSAVLTTILNVKYAIEYVHFS